MLTVGSFFPVALQAQEAEAPMTLSFSHTQFADADLDRGGELGSTQTSLGLGYDWSKGRGEAIGLSVGVGLKDYDFSGATIIPGADAWGQVTELDLGMSWRRPVGESGMLFIAPNLRSARGEGADWGDSPSESGRAFLRALKRPAVFRSCWSTGRFRTTGASATPFGPAPPDPPGLSSPTRRHPAGKSDLGAAGARTVSAWTRTDRMPTASGKWKVCRCICGSPGRSMTACPWGSSGASS